MSLARKHRPGGDSRVGYGVGKAVPGTKATGAQTAPLYAYAQPGPHRPAPGGLPAPARAHLNSTPGAGKSGKLRMRWATSCSRGSAIAAADSTCAQARQLCGARPGRARAGPPVGGGASGWQEGRAGHSGRGWPAPVGSPVFHQIFYFKTPVYFVYPERKRGAEERAKADGM